MKNITSYKELILKEYCFNEIDNIFLLKQKEEKSNNDLYSETADKIKIIRALRDNGAQFKELESGDIKIY
jgi:hypothetical protein